jgi:membrane protease YdiL (CAAX protease family)
MTLYDHLFVVVFAIVFPVAGFISFQRLLKKAEAGLQIDRGHLYRTTAIHQWSLFFAGLFLWVNSARSLSLLGLELQINQPFLIGAALTIASIIVLLLQLRQVMSASQEKIAAIRKMIGKLSFMLPQTGNELARFYMVSITAGIVEEILWRGFLIWYLSQMMPLWSAALLSAIAFGLAHAYQGWAQVPKITLVGAAFAGLYLLSGSIWLPMILHAAVDILQGRLTYEALHRSHDNLDNKHKAAA